MKHNDKQGWASFRQTTLLLTKKNRNFMEHTKSFAFFLFRSSSCSNLIILRVVAKPHLLLFWTRCVKPEQRSGESPQQNSDRFLKCTANLKTLSNAFKNTCRFSFSIFD